MAMSSPSLPSVPALTSSPSSTATSRSLGRHIRPMFPVSFSVFVVVVCLIVDSFVCFGGCFYIYIFFFLSVFLIRVYILYRVMSVCASASS